MLATLTPTQSNETPSSVIDIPRTDDRRANHRVCRRAYTNVTALGSIDRVACTIENVSEGGAYLTAPVDCGLRLGDRCELSFGSCLDAPSGQRNFCSEDSAYATIIRTETASSNGNSSIGIGIRFDQPIYF